MIPMLRGAVTKLKKGLRVSGFTIYASKITVGRFEEEKNVELSIKSGKHEENLMIAKIFLGRGEHYGPWVELFGINPKIRLGKKTLKYYDSAVEKSVITLFANSIENGEIFIEYNDDVETKWQLHHGVPPALSRLGYILYNLGYTWFKDWYYPEGFMEGGMKLQAEDTLDHEKDIEEEAGEFLLNFKSSKDKYVRKALERAKIITQL